MEALKHICGKARKGSEVGGSDFPQSIKENLYQPLFETTV